MLHAACAPLATHSPTLLLRRRGARLACARVLLLHGEKDAVAPQRGQTASQSWQRQSCPPCGPRQAPGCAQRPCARAERPCAINASFRSLLTMQVPPSSSALFALALARAGHAVELVPLPRDTHGSFLLDLSLGRECDLLPHLKRFCSTAVSRL